MKPPYLILHKQNRILNTPNSVACVFDDSGSKCKMMYHFKISAVGGILPAPSAEKAAPQEANPAQSGTCTPSLLRRYEL